MSGSNNAESNPTGGSGDGSLDRFGIAPSTDLFSWSANNNRNNMMNSFHFMHPSFGPNFGFQNRIPPPPPPPPPPAPPTARPTSRQSKQGDKSGRYTVDEKEHLANLMVEIRPIGQAMWDEVTNRYNEQFPGRERTRENLQRQFNTLANKKMPTGDPNMPSFVRLCKKAKHLMIKDSELTTMDSDDEEEEEKEEEEKQDDLAEEEKQEDDATTMATREQDVLAPTPTGNTTAAILAVTAASSRTSSTPAARKKRNSSSRNKGKGKAGEEDALDKYVKVMLIQEKMKNKREAKREKDRNRCEKKQTKFFMQMMATAVTALCGRDHNNTASGLPHPPSFLSSSSSSSSCSSSSSSSLSSIDSNDSPPTKRLKKLEASKKQDAGKKMKKNNKKRN